MRRCPTLLKVLAAASAFGMGLQPASTQADGLATYTLTSTNGLAAPTGPPPAAPITLSGNVSNGSATVAVPSTTGITVGYEVTGNGIPSGTTVTQVGSSGSQVTLSESATASAANESLTFAPTIAPPQVVALVEPAGGVITPPSSSTQGPLTILAGSQGFNVSGVYDYLASKDLTTGSALQALGVSFYGQGLASLANGGILKFSLDVADQSAPPQLVSQTPGVSIALQPSDSSTGSSGNTTGTTSVGGNVGALDTPEPLSVLVWSALAGAGLLRLRALRKPRPSDRD
jgi:hypothetical protein